MIVSYGVSISTVADNLIESVKYKVEEFTGNAGGKDQYLMLKALE